MTILKRYIQDHIDWSKSTLGDGERTTGLIKHIKKELQEIEGSPGDIMEWIDVIILAIDGAWRVGFSAEEIAESLVIKQDMNKLRKWVKAGEGEPIEHDRSS